MSKVFYLIWFLVTIDINTIYEDQDCKIIGDMSYYSYPNELAHLWLSKPRKTPMDLMLAKAENESMYRPFISRLEKAWIYSSASKDTFEHSTHGLFQINGRYLSERYICSLKDYDVPLQLDIYDELMHSCLIRANNNYRIAIHYYNTPFRAYTNQLFVEHIYNLTHKYKFNQ